MDMQTFSLINSKIADMRETINTKARPNLTKAMNDYIAQTVQLYRNTTILLDRFANDGRFPKEVIDTLRSSVDEVYNFALNLRNNVDETLDIFKDFDVLDINYNSLINGSSPIEEKQLNDIYAQYHRILERIAVSGKFVEGVQAEYETVSARSLDKIREAILKYTDERE